MLTHKSTSRTIDLLTTHTTGRMERRKEVDPEGYQIYGLGNWGETKGSSYTTTKSKRYQRTTKITTTLLSVKTSGSIMLMRFTHMATRMETYMYSQDCMDTRRTQRSGYKRLTSSRSLRRVICGAIQLSPTE